MEDVYIRGSGVKGIKELCVLSLQLCSKSKLILKMMVVSNQITCIFSKCFDFFFNRNSSLFKSKFYEPIYLPSTLFTSEEGLSVCVITALHQRCKF